MVEHQIVQGRGRLPVPSPLCSLSLPSPLLPDQKIPFWLTFWEGHWLIIGNSSPFITHQWHCVHAYLLKTPIGSYANWGTIISPINDGGGRTCLFLTTLFAVLSVSLSPSLQRRSQGEHPFITSLPPPPTPPHPPLLPALQNQPTALSSLCYQHTVSINAPSKDITLCTW